MRLPNPDQLLLGATLAAAVASFAWYGWQAPVRARSRRPDTSVAKATTAAYVPASLDDRVMSTGKWLPPTAQTRGAGWIYDVFTPPEIFFDATANRFDVSPPDSGTRIVAPGAPSGLELVAVKREPFRLQLVGYVGNAGNYLGTFENRLTTGVFLAGAGRQVPELDLMITDFAVEWRPVPMADGTTSNQWVATAVVRDEHTGRNTTLTVGEPGYTDELRAVLAVTEDDDESIREVRAGEEIRSLDHTYKIERLQLDPPRVELTGISAEWSRPVRLSLTPESSRLQSR